MALHELVFDEPAIIDVMHLQFCCNRLCELVLSNWWIELESALLTFDRHFILLVSEHFRSTFVYYLEFIYLIRCVSCGATYLQKILYTILCKVFFCLYRFPNCREQIYKFA